MLGNFFISLLLFLAITTFSVLPVFAGGGPISFSAEPNAPLNPGEQYIVHAQVYADGEYPTYCKNCFIKLALKNPQESDYIAQSSDRTDNDGRIYAKVISKVSGERVVYASELLGSNGEKRVSNSSIILRYRGNGSSGQSENPNGNYTDSGSTSVAAPTSVKVIPQRLPQVPLEKNPQPSPTTVSISSTPLPAQQEDVDKKVKELEGKLEGINQRQTYLEKLVENLTSFIRSIFPF